MASCFFIAEAGVNHNGSLDHALALVEVAAKAGADAVKFQTFTADKLVQKGAAKADYQIETTGDGDQYSLLKALELTDDMHRAIVAHCARFEIEFMSTAFDEEAADYLEGLGMRRFKVPSGEITNHPLLVHLAKKNLPMILSTGMCHLQDVEEAVAVIKQTRQHCGFSAPLSEMLSVLHCTSNYPAQMAHVNLRAMDSMAQALSLPIGYSDHTEGILISPAAVARGAVIIEKHFTLDRDMEGPDHRASITPEELGKLVSDIRQITLALGDGIKQPFDSELQARQLVRKSISYRYTYAAGTVITEDDLIMLRPGDGIQPKQLSEVVGRRLCKDVAAGTMVDWEDLS